MEMPSKNKKPDPNTEVDNEDDAVVGPGPKDGAPIEDNDVDKDDPNPDDLDNEDEDEDEDGAGGEDDDPPKLSDSDRKIQDLEERLETMKREQRQAQQAAQPKKEEPKEEINWEEELFTDPNAAVKKLKEEIRKEVTSEYQRDQGQRQFWDSFYAKHDDLKDDDDLVKATLSKNMADLATMPVDAAGDKLADLTRERIMRYQGKKPPKGKKAKVEGNDPPSSKKKAPDKPQITSLGDLIRARKNRRSKAATA